MDLPDTWNQFVDQCGAKTLRWLDELLCCFNSPRDRRLLREVAIMAFREGRVYQAGKANETIDAVLAELRRAGNA